MRRKVACFLRSPWTRVPLERRAVPVRSVVTNAPASTSGGSQSMKTPIEFVIRSVGAIDPDTLRGYAERRLAFALRRFEPHTHRATVRCDDVNGPKHGVDSCCAITLQLRDGRRIDVKAITAWPFASITLATKRLSAVLRRELEKKQVLLRRPRRHRFEMA